MNERNHFEELAARSEADLQARRVLVRWQGLSERGRKLSAEPSALRSFQPETEHPQNVGLHETASDAYTPEELVRLFTDEPQVLDWNGDGTSECVALGELAEAC
jgi:hypothetical protein